MIQYLPSIIQNSSLTIKHQLFQRLKFVEAPLALWRGVRG